ncbi:MAG: LysR family transcriptional regulator [Burkholderiales bacterium]|nr:LysR family transcriptional regulator [Burkholderiales bacterium]
MNLSLRQLRAFVAVAGTGSFTGAAKQLHITQSALSLLIKDLESELGVRLLDRTTRAVALSDVGHAFFPLVHGVLQDLERAVASVADLRDLKRGVARIAAPQIMSLTLLPQALAAHRARYPGVQARIVECLMEELPAKVISGEADLGVGPERTVGPEIEVIPLMKAPVMLVCPQRHPLAVARKVTWRDVLAWPFVAQRGEYSAKIDRDLSAHSRDLRLHPSDEVTYVTTALSMVSSGLGLTACPEFVRPLAKSFGLHMRAVVEPKMVREFCIFVKRRQALSPAAASLLASLKEVAKKL